MEDTCAMILTSFTKNSGVLIATLLLFSCESVRDLMGLSDDDIEQELISSTPELVLPPDFGKQATKSIKKNKQSSANQTIEMQNFPTNYSVQPKVTNYLAPQYYLPSSKTPSDSLEKFKQNKKFTIGEWVYGQYVQGYKEGNIYYKPVYDKGYNFSRRYLPDQNINSFRNPMMYEPNFSTQQPFSEIPSSTVNSNIENFGDLPILD